MNNNDIYEEIIGLQNRTNINYNNNNNNNNKVFNKINLYGLNDREQEVVSPEATPPSGKTSVSLCSPGESGYREGDLPPDWNWCKLDLFLNQMETNSQLKLALTISNNKKEIVRLMAALNSPYRHFKRNIKNYTKNKHYQAVDLYVRFLKAEYGLLKKHINVSKVMLRNGKKDGIIPNLSVVHFKHNLFNHITIYKNTTKYTYVLNDDVSNFRSYKNNEVIGSKMIRATEYKAITMKSLGI